MPHTFTLSPRLQAVVFPFALFVLLAAAIAPARAQAPSAPAAAASPAPAQASTTDESDSASALRQSFIAPPDDSRIMVRWWWFGPSVTQDELERELRAMKAGGIGGVNETHRNLAGSIGASPASRMLRCIAR